MWPGTAIPRAALALLLTAAAAAGCRARADQPPASAEPKEQKIVWRQLGSWSGHGSRQTESFTSDTGTLRIKWQTSPLAGTSGRTGAARDGSAGPGHFRLDAHSAISGRLLQPVVDHEGPGSGLGYVQQDPHVFYVVVESTQLDWAFTVEEAIGYP